MTKTNNLNILSNCIRYCILNRFNSCISVNYLFECVLIGLMLYCNADYFSTDYNGSFHLISKIKL